MSDKYWDNPWFPNEYSFTFRVKTSWKIKKVRHRMKVECLWFPADGVTLDDNLTIEHYHLSDGSLLELLPCIKIRAARQFMYRLTQLRKFLDTNFRKNFAIMKELENGEPECGSWYGMPCRLVQENTNSLHGIA